jgi:hypothetical protein
MRCINWIPVLVAVFSLLTNFEAQAQSDYPSGTPTGTSVSGTVVSTSGDELVLRTATGEQTYRLSSTVDRTGLTPGATVTLWYDAPGTAGSPATVTRVTMGSTDHGTTTPRTTTSEDELPATAGFLPILGLIGILALSGGLLMRKGRRSVAR